MDISRRVFLSLAPAAVLGFAISRPASAQFLDIVEFSAYIETGGLLALSRRGGTTLLCAPLAPRGTFRWFAAPGGEIRITTEQPLVNGSCDVEFDHMVVRYNGSLYAVTAGGTFPLDTTSPPLTIALFAR